MTRDQQIAWAAGLFEGEGCITGHRGRSARHVALVMADEDIVRRFAAIVRIGAVRGDGTLRRPHHRHLWRWQADGDGGEAVLHLLLPYLGARRSARAKEMLAMRTRWREHAMRLRACPQCGVNFQPKTIGPNAAKQRYCSRDCQQRAYRRLHRSVLA
jgi:hypothetical protein